MKLEVTEAAKSYLIENGYDQIYGARPLKRFVKKKLETIIAEKILKDDIAPMDTMIVNLEDGKLIIQ